MSTTAAAETNKPVGRPPKRSPLRERLHGKTRMDTQNSDKFAVPNVPEGVSVEWKSYAVAGKTDDYYIASLKRQGWELMDAEDFPDLVPEGARGPIIKEGMALMGRPMELTLQAIAEQERLARGMVRDKEKQLGLAPAGTGPRDHPDVRPRISKEVMRPVPVED